MATGADADRDDADEGTEGNASKAIVEFVGCNVVNEVDDDVGCCLSALAERLADGVEGICGNNAVTSSLSSSSLGCFIGALSFAFVVVADDVVVGTCGNNANSSSSIVKSSLGVGTSGNSNISLCAFGTGRAFAVVEVARLPPPTLFDVTTTDGVGVAVDEAS